MNGTVTTYVLHGKNVVHLTQGSNNLHFFYGADGSPAIVEYNGVSYGYVKNLQGDVIGIVNASGAYVVQYAYDAWGRLVSKTGSMASTLGTLNPFRYRGYVYDEETGLYYLRSRYFNPTWCRFVNADTQLTYPQLLNCNLFSHCQNNPVILRDPDGTEAIYAVGQTSGFLALVASGMNGLLPIGIIIAATASLVHLCNAIPATKDIPIAQPSSMTYTGLRELEDVQTNEFIYGGTYYWAYLGSDGFLYKVGPGMGYREAVLSLGVEIVRKDKASKYGKNRWGVYTEQQIDAKALAVAFGWTSPPEAHGINYFGHYHDNTHAFHIWFGSPIP